MSILKESPLIFYSFRRCPYAMRARLSLVISKTRVEIREVYLKEKPKEFLASSLSATVPCMVTQEKIIDESLDIMVWVLKKNDPQNWLKMPKIGFDLIKENDGPFKHYLDKKSKVISIKDNGYGIEKKSIHRIFERFYRSSKARAHTKGTGLGLALVKQLSARIGSNITVQSQINSGTEFFVSFKDK